MKKVDSKIIGDLEINEDTQFIGMITGSMTIHKNCTVGIFGIIGKDLIIDKDSHVDIRGVVNGEISNKGNLDIFGIVNGKIHNLDGIVHIHPKAIVEGNTINNLKEI